jgi:SAM-dependent methyltransferase
LSETCRGCGTDAVEGFLDLGEMPLAGGFLNGPEEIAEEERYPLAISACGECGLVQITDPVDPSILFSDYSFKTGTIPGLVKHFEAYAEWIAARFSPATVVEFGANDGTLVAALEQRGVRAVGVDLADNITEMAREQGRDVITGAFSRELADELAGRLGGPADLVTGSNVFAHNSDPGAILDGADAVLVPDGVLCLEVMYAGDLLEQLQWDTLYHEHLTFYSLGTLERLLGRHGFEVVEAERVPMHGGSLRVAAARGGRERSGTVAELAAWEAEYELNEVATWDRFADDSRRRIAAFGDSMRRLARSASIWAYGAAGKATMWVNACEMNYLEAVVDASPLRYGKLMPGTHTPIVSPDDFKQSSPDYVFASAWNYLDAIRANEPQYQGYWIVPLPEMRIY